MWVKAKAHTMRSTLRVGYRKLVQVTEEELAPWHPGLRPGEHVGRAIHADNPMATTGQKLGIATCPARGIQRDAHGQRLHNFFDQWFVDIERPVRPVIRCRPQPISRNRVHPVDFHRCVY